MVAPTPKISIRCQCELLQISRSGYYRKPARESEKNMRIMEHIDRLHTEDPSAGARRLVRYLKRDGYGPVGRRRVRRLMRVMQIESVYCRPRTSARQAGAKIYPYLLGNLSIDRPNQVWCSDITYIPMPRGFLYVVAILDWYSRKVLAWDVSNTYDADFCVRVLERAVARTGTGAEIMNTDQGSQYTSGVWLAALEAHGIRISMDGKGCWRDNVIIERFWRTLKYEDIYLWRYGDGHQLSHGVEKFVAHYNERRPHSSLGGATPSEVYADGGLFAKEVA